MAQRQTTTHVSSLCLSTAMTSANQALVSSISIWHIKVVSSSLSNALTHLAKLHSISTCLYESKLPHKVYRSHPMPCSCNVQRPLLEWTNSPNATGKHRSWIELCFSICCSIPYPTPLCSTGLAYPLPRATSLLDSDQASSKPTRQKNALFLIVSCSEVGLLRRT